MRTTSKKSVRRKRRQLLSLREYFCRLLPRFRDDESIPMWPPDVFGLCMSVLQKTGAYCNALSDWPPHMMAGSPREKWRHKVERLGDEWREDWPKKIVPNEVQSGWKRVSRFLDTPLRNVKVKPQLCQGLLELASIADEASANMGLPGSTAIGPQKFFIEADDLLSNVLGSTLGREIDSDVLRILPKMRTPQTGLTIRSLSHNLALWAGDEVTPRWAPVGSNPSQEREKINLLVVPWPDEVVPSQFFETKRLSTEMRNMSSSFGMFSFRSTNKRRGFVRYVEMLHSTAAESCGKIDGVVFPELAVTPKEHKSLKSSILRRGSFLISGVGTSSVPRVKYGENLIHIDIPPNQVFTQRKHHRWKLDESQVQQYGLGGLLNPERKWWEHIDVSERELLFLAMQNWLVMTVLICEDLARPDPVGDLVRAVGPNLVIALLMDGPQLRDRWAARHATTLAEDPGSSVLTVTSLGMSKLSRPAAGKSRSRVIALWKDAKNTFEIELPEGDDAVVLSLTVRYLREWAADGRSDHRNAGYPMLFGIHPIRLASN